MADTSREDMKTILMMVLTTMFWGGSFVASKIALPEFPPMTLTFFRFIIATVIIFPYMWSQSSTKVPEKKDLPLLFGLGFLGVSGYFAFQFTALLYTSAANASTINALNPLVSSILATIVTDERLSRKRVSLLLLALVGVMLTITGGNTQVLLKMEFNKGDMIMTLAMLSFAIYGIYSKKASQRYEPLLVTSYVFLFGLIQITPLMIREAVLSNVLSFSGAAWGGVIFMALGSSVLGYQIQQVAIKRLGVNKTSLFINLVPLWAILFSYLVLGDRITIINIISAVIIGTAVYLNTRNGKD
jgi:drug/metabolite transporter (DMT)-like permease